MNDVELIESAAALILTAEDEWGDAPKLWRAKVQDWRDGYDEHRERQRLTSGPPDLLMPPPEAFEDGVIQPDPSPESIEHYRATLEENELDDGS